MGASGAAVLACLLFAASGCVDPGGSAQEASPILSPAPLPLLRIETDTQVNMTVPSDGSVHAIEVSLAVPSRFIFSNRDPTRHVERPDLRYGFALVPLPHRMCAPAAARAFDVQAGSGGEGGYRDFGILQGDILPAGSYELWAWNNVYLAPMVLYFTTEEGNGTRYSGIVPHALGRPGPSVHALSGSGPANATLELPASASLAFLEAGAYVPLGYTGDWTFEAGLQGPAGWCVGVKGEGASMPLLQPGPGRSWMAAHGPLSSGRLSLGYEPMPNGLPTPEWSWSMFALAFE